MLAPFFFAFKIGDRPCRPRGDPDITFVVNKLCKYMANPADSHVDVFERLLRYLIGTRDLGLVYSFNGVAPPVMAYSDSSHLGCVNSSRSTLAYLFFFYGQVITW